MTQPDLGIIDRFQLSQALRRQGCRSIMLFALLGSALPDVASAEDFTSISQFNAQSNNWSRLIGRQLTLEGRCAALSPERLLMTKCTLIFEFADGVIVPRSKPKNVIITGRLEQRGSRIVFVVSRFRSRLGDLEQLGTDRSDINVNQPDEWYGLADRTRLRAAFYEDEELDAQAADLYRQGVQAEYRRLPADESAGLIALAERTGRLGLPDRLRMEFLHEAVSREFETAQSDQSAGFDTAISRALEWLPGARIPLLQFDDETRRQQAAYLEDRCDIYEAAEDDGRPLLERLLYIEAALNKIERDVADDGHNGFEIAERIEESVPELDELPEEYRLREIDWQTENVARTTREEMLVLVDRLEDRDHEARAIDIRRTWLNARSVRLNRAGVSGRLELAEEYLELLGDEKSAVDIYRELYESPEGQTIAANRLQLLGYTFDGEDWRSESLPENDDELSMAIRNGSVRTGMTESDVRAALGRPEVTLRIASRGQVVELWVYPGPGISIHFARRNIEGEQEAIEVFNLPAQTREQIRQ